jgi:hypothetical protein
MNDKPSRRRRNLLHDLSDAVDALELSGCPPEQADRIAVAAAVAIVNAAYGLTAARRVPPVPEPEWGWTDGVWTVLEPETDTTREDTTMPRMGAMFPSKWLAAADLDDADLTLTIASCSEEQVTPQDNKWVLWFEEVEKGMVLNKTNSKMIAALLLSDDTDEWVGRKITLFPTQVDFQGDQVDAIRVRKKLPMATKKVTKKTAPAMTQAEADEAMGDGARDEEEDVPF